MDLIDRQLLNIIQSKFPLTDRPYLAIGEDLGLEEGELIERLAELKRQNVVRQISAIFDTRRLGYKTTLVAFAYHPEQLHRGALFINRHPGVSHNYAREGSYYNLWFTIAVPPDGDLESTIAWMAEKTGALNYRIMPTIRFFKIGVNFDMVKEKSSAHNYNPDGIGEATLAKDWNQAVPVSEKEKAAIRELQEDLPLVPRPFEDMVHRLGMTTSQLFQLAQDFQDRKLMRRYSAVLHHRRSGFKSNAMIVWKVPAERSEEVGMKMAQHSAVTHCYERPTFPDWQYTHFTMVHATTPDGCEEIAREISDATGITDNVLLYSTREYKKTRVKYFVEDYQQFWETAEQAEAMVEARIKRHNATASPRSPFQNPPEQEDTGSPVGEAHQRNNMPDYYPVYLNLGGKRCVIFGGGTIAQGKIAALRQAGARITVISPDATPGIQRAAQRGDVEWVQRKYQPCDLEGAFIAVAATNVWHINREIYEEAEQSGVLLNVVDDPDLCTFIAPSIVKRDPVTLAISTGGASPALARKMRETFAEDPNLRWADLADVLARARKVIKEQRTIIDPDRWQCCITEELLSMVQNGQEEAALDQLLSRLTDKSTPDLCPNLGQCSPEGCLVRPKKKTKEKVS